MKCDKCGQECCKHPDSKLFLQKSCGDINLFCNVCGHNFGPVRELIEKAGLWNLYGSSAGAAELIATLTRERDESQGREVRSTNASLGLRRDLDEANAKVFTLTRERDEIREYASISDRQFSDMKFLFEQAKRDLEDERKTTRARIAELEKERTEARKERDKAICDAGIAKSHADYLERASEVFGVRSFVVHANGTWEWRKG